MSKITVRYWRGTTQFEDKADTYEAAQQIAARNNNAYGPTFWDENGEQLHDDGAGLCYGDPEIVKHHSGLVEERRFYAF